MRRHSQELAVWRMKSRTPSAAALPLFFFNSLQGKKKKKLKLYKSHELIADKLMEFAQEPELEINSI